MNTVRSADGTTIAYTKARAIAPVLTEFFTSAN
jgi:hypothetical protein